MLPIAPNTILQQRYRILEILGEGKFGRTYLATDNARARQPDRQSSEEHCAIEELIPSTQFPGTVAKAKAAFTQSAELLYQLQHPQIPRLWATFEEQNRLFLVQDYIEGKTYGQLIDDRRDRSTQFSEFEVWQFLLQILPVMGYMHDRGVIHRNISPDNIIRRDLDGLPVPIEFGVIKEFAAKLQPSPSHPSNIAIGQPGYAPPEQLQSGLVAPHSDLYALAVVAIGLITGKEPQAFIEGGRLNENWRRWIHIDDRFAQILTQMLSPKPTDRYQSAHQVFQALQPLDLPASQPNGIPLGQNHPSVIPTRAVSSNRPAPKRPQAAITSLKSESIWEKPQVFIPVGVLISLLAGIGSWIGVTQLLHGNRSTDPVVSSEPSKQVDFNNPTIPTDTNPTPSSSTIEPVMGQAILKEGTVGANSPVRYRIAAVSGQNLDIQLVTGSPTVASGKSPTPTPVTVPGVTKLDPVRPNSIAPNPSPSPSVKPSTATQVLMTILSPTGTPIDAGADRVVGWRGEIPVTGDYTIELRPIAGLTGNAFPYKLSVTQLAAPIAPNSSNSGTPYGTAPPVVVPVPNRGGTSSPLPSDYLPKSPDNNSSEISPSPVPIQIPTVRPTVEPLPEPERPKSRTPRRNRIEDEPQPAPKARERRRSSDDDRAAPPPRRRSQRPSNPEPSPQPTPSTPPESDGTIINGKPKSEPSMTPSTSDNQAPQPNTTDGGNSSTSTKEPKSSPAVPVPNNSTDTD
jgi:serine/threonine protein kinase